MSLLALPYFLNNCCILVAAILGMNSEQADYYNIKTALILGNYNIKAEVLYLMTSGKQSYYRDSWLKADINQRFLPSYDVDLPSVK